ncbi:hypothetical protein [Pseudomonas sp. NPDC089406]|uniref:hypothetical protein n=1 Tax=Pseudomonas sp. NPDC089406 TaxID=3364463 RepID=UPI00384AECFC
MPAITGAAGAMHRVVCFAVIPHFGKPASAEAKVEYSAHKKASLRWLFCGRR